MTCRHPRPKSVHEKHTPSPLPRRLPLRFVPALRVLARAPLPLLLPVLLLAVRRILLLSPARYVLPLPPIRRYSSRMWCRSPFLIMEKVLRADHRIV